MSNPFSPVPLSASLRALAATTLPVQLYAQTLLQQPIVSLDSVPNLSPDLTSAHAVAKATLTDLMPQARRVGADVLGFANQIVAFYPTMLTQAQAVDAGGANGAAAAKSLAQGLQLLTGKINALLPDLNELDAQSSAIAASAASVSVKLAADAQAAAGDQNISQLQAQIASALQAINTDCQTISTGLKGAIKGLVKLAIAEYKAEDKPLKAVKAFVGTILTVAKQSETVSAAENDALSQINQLGAMYAELSPMLFAAAVVQTASTSAGMFTQSATALQVEAQGAASDWSALAAGFDSLARTLAVGEAPPTPLAPLLAADQAGWQTMATEAAALQGVELLQVTVTPWTGAAVAA